MREGWEVRKLKEITNKIGSGATPKGGKVAYKTSGIPLIRSLNVHDGLFKKKNLAFIDDIQAEKLSNVIVQNGDVLLNITGASITRCCVAPQAFLPARVNQHVSIIRPKPELVNTEFLAYLLISKECKDLLLETGDKAGATRQALTKVQLQDFVVPLPPFAEQKWIVALLDEAFAGIAVALAAASKNLKNARALFETTLNATFTQKGEGWVETTLGEVCSITSKLIDPKEDEYLDLPHLGAGNMISDTGEIVDVKTAREEGLISGKFVFDPDTVLYSKIRPYLKKACRPDFKGLCSADVYPLSVKPEIISKDYLYHLLMSNDFTEYAISGSSRAGMPKVNRSHLFAYKFRVPDISLQQELISRLDALNIQTQALEALYQKKIDALNELKQSLLQKAFAGELTAAAHPLQAPTEDVA